MSDFTVVNAKVVTPSQVLPDSCVRISDGIIREIGARLNTTAEVVDAHGCYLLPGFIDLHCDAIEKSIEPRPNTFFPVDVALTELDKNLAACGVTTIYHSLSFAEMEIGLRSNAMAAGILRQVNGLATDLRVRTRIHARFEITDNDAMDVLEQLIREGEIHLFSFMDHSPGQGQFKTLTSFRDYYGPVYKKTAAEIDAIIARKLRAKEGSAQAGMERMLSVCRECNLPVASHDDDSPQRISWLAENDITLSEFPTCLETARAAREHGVRTVLGAPNVFRGVSQAKNLNAREAIGAGCGDILCSDYAPMTLVHAVFTLVQLGLRSLSEAVRMATLTPAQAVELDHLTGSLEVGKAADMVLVRYNGGFPRILKTFVNGKEVFVTC